MADVVLIVAAVVMVGVSLPLAVTTLAKRRFKRAKITAIADAKDGDMVRVVGVVVEPPSPLVAPISAASCVHYFAVIWVGDFKNVAREEAALDSFVIDDKSGTAIVTLGKGGKLAPRVRVEKPREHYSAPASEEAFKAFADRHQLRRDFFRMQGEEYGIQEQAVVCGQTVEVFGRCKCTTSTTEQGAYRSASLRRVHLIAPMVIRVDETSDE